MNMDDKKIDELINKALQEEQALPEGLSRRLEKQIDTWASTEEKKTRSLTRRRTVIFPLMLTPIKYSPSVLSDMKQKQSLSPTRKH